MINALFIGAGALAALDWLAVARHWKRAEYVFKPATLLALIVAAWLLAQETHNPWLGNLFLLALIGSLAGDIFLMLPGDRAFLPGLVAFLLAHLAYIAGLNSAWPPATAWVLAPVIGGIGWLFFSRVAGGLRRSGRTRLIAPVALYALVLSLMLFSAWATLFRAGQSALFGALVVGGATLFFISDALLAWDRFVAPWPPARLLVMITYHLAQMALAASMAWA